MIVKLSDSEYRILGFIGAMRFQATSEQGLERKQSGISSLSIVIDGVISEYAVAKHFNLNFDLNCDYRKFGVDLTSKLGKTIDVKSTRKLGGNLNAVSWSVNKPADIFILVELDFEYINIVGRIDRIDFLKEENLTDVGNGPYYSITQDALKYIL